MLGAMMDDVKQDMNTKDKVKFFWRFLQPEDKKEACGDISKDIYSGLLKYLSNFPGPTGSHTRKKRPGLSRAGLGLMDGR